MTFLLIFLGCVGGVLCVIAWGVWQAFRHLAKTAAEHPGFALRKASLSPAEWRDWNAEYVRWRFFRAAFWLGLGEGILLALALQKIEQLPGLLFFILVGQLLPFFLIYGLHLFLLFRYGRFNLQRFDPAQQVAQRLSLFFVALSAWTPILGTWLFFRLWG